MTALDLISLKSNKRKGEYIGSHRNVTVEVKGYCEEKMTPYRMELMFASR